MLEKSLKEIRHRVDVIKSTRNTVLSREELLEKLAAVTKEKRILAKKINRNAKKTKV